MRANRSITLTLGAQQKLLDDLVAAGEYDSAGGAVGAALRALEREREAIDEITRRKVGRVLTAADKSSIGGLRRRWR